MELEVRLSALARVQSLTFVQEDLNPPTDYGAFVVQVLTRMTQDSQSIDQTILRQCIGLSPSFLSSDTTMNPDSGIHTWFTGFNQLVDVMVALHLKEELELETLNTASRACSECWSIAGSFRGLEEGTAGVRKVALKLKRLLDPSGTTYRGEKVYAP